MGGEKLKSSRPAWAFLIIIIFIINDLFGVTLSIFAQSASSEPDAGISVSENTFENSAEASDPELAAARNSYPDESTIILGESPAVPVPSGSSSLFVALRMVLVLALAALAIYGVVFFIKRISRPQERTDPHLKILARAPLGNDSYAAVISVGAKAWLVGGASGGVSLISEIDDTETLETMLLDDARRSAETANKRFPDFRSLISRLGGSSAGGKSGKQGDAENDSLHENLRKHRDRLRGL